ncbi:MAG: T9SS type A sorting domain-containing protein [Bacteroidetes bacterium]|nr:T9SS type A sorting domain-containing protein [Bacteroidota bacterium]
MKNTILILFAFLFCQSTKAQYIIAGDTTGLYMDIVPDTTFGGMLFCAFDINQDGINDVGIQTYLSYTSIKSYNVYTAIGRQNNSAVAFCYIGGTNPDDDCRSVVKPFNIGDTINKRGNYSNLNTSTRIAYAYSNGSLGGGGCRLWLDNTDHFIGVRYSTNIDTVYGWMRVRVFSENGITVKDFALERNPIVGLRELSANSLRVTAYPNPAQTQVNIKTDEAEIVQIKIVSISGSELINTTQHIIDVSHLPNGIYFAQIKTDKGIGARKIVVQR